MDDSQSMRRRTLLAGLAGVGTAAVAGCLGYGSGGGTPTREPDSVSLPRSPASVPLAYGNEELVDSARDGGVGKDGIPAIEEPTHRPADAVEYLPDDNPVFGLVVDGQAVAYPQRILVQHEIVNDTVAGTPLAVTYCPLTGTALAFHRGDTTFGVSGRLVNSNLVMYDRATDSWWPQMLGRAIRGPFEGQALSEARLTWTTAGRWRAAHPETAVLTTDTGYARSYGRDPYGDYAPARGYYTSDNTLFPPLTRDDRFHPKRVVLGLRTADGALAVPKDRLRSAGVVEATLSGTDYAVVYESTLDTGYAYRNPEGAAVQRDGDRVSVDGTAAPPDALPLPAVNAYDAMWFAWAGFYPETDVRP